MLTRHYIIVKFDHPELNTKNVTLEGILTPGLTFLSNPFFDSERVVRR